MFKKIPIISLELFPYAIWSGHAIFDNINCQEDEHPITQEHPLSLLERDLLSEIGDSFGYAASFHPRGYMKREREKVQVHQGIRNVYSFRTAGDGALPDKLGS